MAKKFEICNSTAEFLTFIAEGKEDGIRCYIRMKQYGQHKGQWRHCLIAQRIKLGVHQKNIFNSNELNKEAATEKIPVVQKEGERGVNRITTISVGYRINSLQINTGNQDRKKRQNCIRTPFTLYLCRIY